MNNAALAMNHKLLNIVWKSLVKLEERNANTTQLETALFECCPPSNEIKTALRLKSEPPHTPEHELSFA